jgi:4'-phosphopantetheinyl transferase
MSLIHWEQVNENSSLGVWRLDESLDELRSSVNLTREEEEYYASFGNERRKKQWLGYRIILQHLMNNKQVTLHYDEFGKPHFPDMGSHLSVSHSGDFSAAIISSRTPVGIDIEKIRDRIERVADRFLSVRESGWISNLHRLEQLHVCWGAKESLYKLHGTTDVDFKTDMELEQFEYICTGKGSISATMHLPEGKRDFIIHYRKMEDYMLVWAVRSSQFAIRFSPFGTARI